MAATLTTKQSKNFLDAQLLGVSSRNLTVLDLDGTVSTVLAGGTVSLDLGYAMGLDQAGALKDPANLPFAAPRAQFGKIKAGFNYARPFSLWGKSFSFSSQLTGQKAESTLYGSEQISIGGIYSVRGFVNNTLSGDDGYYWRNEISVRQPVLIGSETIGTRVYIGYDTGAVRNRAENVPEGRLAGMVVGLSANWRGASWDLFTTRPLSLPDNMTKESSQTWFRVSYSF
jgi:hemolysin activation/secretion protein